MTDLDNSEHKDCSDTPEKPEDNPPTETAGCKMPDPPCWPKEESEANCKSKCKCKCPETSATKPSCLQDLINEQKKTITKAETAEAYKKELESYVAKIAVAEKEYTADKYKNYKELWAAQTKKIDGLLTILRCNISCWDCFVTCEYCSLIAGIIERKKKLYGGYKTYCEVHSLRDERHWWETTKLNVEDELQRILAVLTAWEKPADILKKTLDDNAKLIDFVKDGLTQNQSKAIFALLFKLIPSHIAIAPKDGAGNLDLGSDSELPAIMEGFESWLKSCCGDTVCPDDACGPNIGQLSIRNSLTGPLPYILPPAELSKIICCIVQGPYTCAKTKLANATAELGRVDSEIAETKAFLTKKPLVHLEEHVARLPAEIDCERYKKCDCDCEDGDNNCGDHKDCGCKPKDNTTTS